MNANSPTAEQIADAMRNASDPNRGRRVAARVHAALSPAVSRTLAQLEIYKRLHGNREAKP